ncbi:alpha-amylase family glycosyl hydrolase [Mycoplasma phocimorsus]|uniref:alpha-amylase family glycosyl hydrolase n=2 Tax=Mycoplasma phocimorsus TaxID=3045839 RepID=UPI0024C0D94F|nr:alpha-amylase family glycosyl hydrolase [Mycoplasma phocimorsus]MDJ1646525.1 alpha-amylase family glycosyl hydrolase [Mycoplasma phocimorsus]
MNINNKKIIKNNIKKIKYFISEAIDRKTKEKFFRFKSSIDSDIKKFMNITDAFQEFISIVNETDKTTRVWIHQAGKFRKAITYKEVKELLKIEPKNEQKQDNCFDCCEGECKVETCIPNKDCINCCEGQCEVKNEEKQDNCFDCCEGECKVETCIPNKDCINCCEGQCEVKKEQKQDNCFDCCEGECKVETCIPNKDCINCCGQCEVKKEQKQDNCSNCCEGECKVETCIPNKDCINCCEGQCEVKKEQKQDNCFDCCEGECKVETCIPNKDCINCCEGQCEVKKEQKQDNCFDCCEGECKVETCIPNKDCINCCEGQCEVKKEQKQDNCFDCCEGECKVETCIPNKDCINCCEGQCESKDNIIKTKTIPKEILNQINDKVKIINSKGIRPKDVKTLSLINSLIDRWSFNNTGENGCLLNSKICNPYQFKFIKWNLSDKLNSTTLDLHIEIFRNDKERRNFESAIKVITLEGFAPNTEEEPKINKTLIIHFKPNEKIDNWGIHLFNSNESLKAIAQKTEWKKPILFNKNADKDGFYKAEIDIINLENGLKFMLHKDNIKHFESALEFPKYPDYAEFWFLMNDKCIYESRPNEEYKTQFIKRVEENVIDLKFKKRIKDKNYSINLLNITEIKTNEIVDYEVMEKTEKDGFLIILDSKYNLGDSFRFSYDSYDLGLEEITRELLKKDTIIYRKSDLGSILLKDGSASVKIWAPVSKNAKIRIFCKHDQTKLIREYKLHRSNEHKYVWEGILNQETINLPTVEEYFYQYVLDYDLNVTEKIVLDPYAYSMASHNPALDSIGKGAFVRLDSEKAGEISPARGIYSGGINGELNAMIAYEIHVRDYTISAKDDMGNPIKYAGTFKGMTNWEEGINYLKKLGITHIEFLPLLAFFGTDEDSKEFVKGEEGKVTNYSWGYDPHSYMSIDGWLASDAKKPYVRIKELRELIKKLHDNNIGVIVDVVYNHMWRNEIYDDIVHGVYFRSKDGITPVGSPAIASEHPMMRDIILRSLRMLWHEYGVDGFRFDMLGYMDNETVHIIRNEFPDAIIYGEAWPHTDLPKGESPVKGWTSYKDHGIKDIGYFNDSIRRAIKGETSEGGAFDRAFVQGVDWKTNLLRSSIIAGIKNFPQNNVQKGNLYVNIRYNSNDIFADSPNEALQYLSIHDGFTLWDKINIATDLRGRTIEEQLDYKLKLIKQSFAILFTSQGRLIINGGDEMGKTKPLDAGEPNIDRSATCMSTIMLPDVNNNFNTSNIYIENSFNSSDVTNQYRWNRLSKSYFGGKFKELSDFVADLIALRKKLYGLRFETAKEIQENFRFFGESKINTEFGPFDSFEDKNLNFIKIKFINAPKEAREKEWFICDIYAKIQKFNEHAIKIYIDKNGYGEVIIPSTIILALSKKDKYWTSAKTFSFRLHEIIDAKNIYDNFAGICEIPYWSISKEKTVEFNFKKQGNKAVIDQYDNSIDNYIQYRIKSPKDPLFEEYIIFSNSSDNDKFISAKLDKSYITLLDENGVHLNGIKKTNPNKVAGNTTVLVAKLRK